MIDIIIVSIQHHVYLQSIVKIFFKSKNDITEFKKYIYFCLVNQSANIKRFSLWLLSLTLVFVLLNNSLFVHVHDLGGGVTVTHAHPFNPFNKNSDNSSQHSHTANEYELFNMISTSLLWIGTLAILLIISNIITNFSIFYKIGEVFKNHNQASRIRPPPQIVL